MTDRPLAISYAAAEYLRSKNATELTERRDLRSPRYPIEKFVGRRDWTAGPRSIPRAQLSPRRRADGTPPRLPVFVSLERRRVRAFAARDAFRGTHVRLIVTCETTRTRLRTRVAHSRVSLLGWLHGHRDARLTSGRRENASRCSTTLRQRLATETRLSLSFL